MFRLYYNLAKKLSMIIVIEGLRKMSSERLSDLAQDTEQVSGRTGFI